MGDWNILKQSNNDYLANITSSYASHHDPDLSQFHIMSSFIERTFSPASLYNENSFCTPDNVEQCISHLNQVCLWNLFQYTLRTIYTGEGGGALQFASPKNAIVMKLLCP